MWFKDWESVARVLVMGVASYAMLIVFLRVSGKRTLTKLNAFDLVVTVAMGSSLSSALLSPTATFAQTAAAFAVLIGGQYVIARLSIAWPWFDGLVKSDPALLLLDGRMLHEAMRRERITEGEVISAVRGAGMARLEDVGAVVLETDGSLHVLQRTPRGGAPTLDGVRKPAA